MIWSGFLQVHRVSDTYTHAYVCASGQLGQKKAEDKVSHTQAYTRVSGIYMYVQISYYFRWWVWIYSSMCHGTYPYVNIRVNYYYGEGYYYNYYQFKYMKGKATKLEFNWAPNNRAKGMNKQSLNLEDFWWKNHMIWSWEGNVMIYQSCNREKSRGI